MLGQDDDLQWNYAEARRLLGRALRVISSSIDGTAKRADMEETQQAIAKFLTETAERTAPGSTQTGIDKIIAVIGPTGE